MKAVRWRALPRHGGAGPGVPFLNDGAFVMALAIARAIVSDPTLLLCDEPTGDLDRETADEILQLLQALNREHAKTIVMVTHDPQAAEFANRTLHLDKGTLTNGAA